MLRLELLRNDSRLSWYRYAFQNRSLVGIFTALLTVIPKAAVEGDKNSAGAYKTP